MVGVQTRQTRREVVTLLGISLELIAGIWIALYMLPDLLFHHMQCGAWHGADTGRRVALTFDDGPDSATRDILSELDRLAVKATFFVVVDQALRHPDWMQSIVAGGHEVGLHGNRHQSSYLQAPWQTARRLTEAARTLAAITGQPVRWYRPPWGHHNLGTWWACRRLGLRRVLWTVAPNDWKVGHSPAGIARHVVRASLPGGIVVLHDGGGNRPATVGALPMLIDGLRAGRLEPGRVSDLEEEGSSLKWLWKWWEARFSLHWAIDRIPSGEGNPPILRVGRIHYRGPRLHLGGATLEPGDPFAEIHFDNSVLAQFSGAGGQGIIAYRAVGRALDDLVAFLDREPKYRGVKVAGGITILDAGQAIDRLGFVRVPVTGFRRWTMWAYLVLLKALYHREGWRTLRRMRHLRPVLLVVSIGSLRRRFASQRRPHSSDKASG